MNELIGCIIVTILIIIPTMYAFSMAGVETYRFFKKVYDENKR